MPDAATVSVRQSLSASSPSAPLRPFATAPPAGATGPGQIPGGTRRGRRRPLSLLPGLPARAPQLWFLVGFLVSQSGLFLLPLALPRSLRLSRPAWALSRAAGASRAAAAAMGGARPRFLLFGDSLTQQSFRDGGWGAALQDQYARKADVILRGYSGYNTRWALYLLPELFPPQEASPHSGPLRLVTVFFGANDAVLPDRSSRKQFVPLEEFRQNLVKIVTAAQESASTANIVLITPPPVDPPGRLRYYKEVYKENAVTEFERVNENTAKYAEACKDVARELGVPVVDLFTRIQQRPQWEGLFNDGLHFTPEGNKVVFEELMSVVEASFPSLKWDKMPWDFPEHLEIDGDQPGKAFA